MFNERVVITAVIKGDMKAFELLVKQYEKLVFFVISRLINEKEDIEDACQEVFIKVYKSLGSFAFQSKLGTWIARIAYLTSINELKKNKRQRISQDPGDLDNFHFTHENPEELTEKKMFPLYQSPDSKMPAQYKTVLTLYHLNEFSYQDIEEITGMPEGTVKSYLFRARKLLKEKIEEYLKSEHI